MGHAIGQHHEQSRADRDDHVIMNWANINGGTGNINMQKFNTHDYNPYVYQSVLQYALTVRISFSKKQIDASVKERLQTLLVLSEEICKRVFCNKQIYHHLLFQTDKLL